MTDLHNFIEQDRLSVKSDGIALYSSAELDVINIKQENINYEEQINNLKLSLRIAETMEDDRKKEIELLKADKFDEKSKDLIEHYKSTSDSLFKLKATFILTFIFGVVTQIEKITQLISKYSPVSPSILKGSIFVVLVFIPLVYLKVFYEQKRVHNLSKRILTPLCLNQFMIYLDDQNCDDTFSELTVFQFLTNLFTPKNGVINFFYVQVIRIHTDDSINTLKDVFIYYLIKKQFVTIISAKNLDRQFKIKNYKSIS